MNHKFTPTRLLMVIFVFVSLFGALVWIFLQRDTAVDYTVHSTEEVYENDSYENSNEYLATTSSEDISIAIPADYVSDTVYSESGNRIAIHQFPDNYDLSSSPYPYLQRLTRSGDCVADINLTYCKEFLALMYNGQILIENKLVGSLDKSEMEQIDELAQKLKTNINQCTATELQMTKQVWSVTVQREQYIIDTMNCNELVEIGDLIDKKVLQK